MSGVPPTATTAKVDMDMNQGKSEGKESGGYYDTNLEWVPTRPLRTAAKYVYPFAYKTYLVMDWIGGKVAYGIGATQSRFQYAVDEYNRQERRKARKEELERQRVLERKRRAGMLAEEDDSEDELLGDGSREEVHIPYVPPVMTHNKIIPGEQLTATADQQK